MKSLLSEIFGAAVRWNNFRFDLGKAAITRCGAPVISVGNLCMGGSGKTPFAIMLAKEILKLGKTPAIIGKGYKRKEKGLLIVSDGSRIFADADSAGDEMILIAEAVGAPVLIHNTKTDAACEAVRTFLPDVIIVDDGFQHRRLHRELDIVLLDAQTLENPRLFPKGRLREPLGNIRRADILAIPSDIKLDDFRTILPEDKLIIRTEIVTDGFDNLFNSNKLETDFETLSSAGAALCGIANPGRFAASLDRAGIKPERLIYLPDHTDYTYRKIDNILKDLKKNGIQKIFTTKKDAVKLRNFSDLFLKYGTECHVLCISLVVIENDKKFIWILESILSK